MEERTAKMCSTLYIIHICKAGHGCLNVSDTYCIIYYVDYCIIYYVHYVGRH
jgi:hypothetical protein